MRPNKKSWRITDKALPEVNKWQNRPLDKIYHVIFFDGIKFNSRKDNKIVNKCVYSVLGINMDGHKEILGTWISENESASFYASICSDLKNRGVEDKSYHRAVRKFTKSKSISLPSVRIVLLLLHSRPQEILCKTE